MVKVVAMVRFVVPSVARIPPIAAIRTKVVVGRVVAIRAPPAATAPYAAIIVGPVVRILRIAAEQAKVAARRDVVTPIRNSVAMIFVVRKMKLVVMDLVVIQIPKNVATTQGGTMTVTVVTLEMNAVTEIVVIPMPVKVAKAEVASVTR
jgi:hypothetical protein